MSPDDWIIIAAYLLAIVGLGVAAGSLRRKNEKGGEGGPKAAALVKAGRYCHNRDR